MSLTARERRELNDLLDRATVESLDDTARSCLNALLCGSEEARRAYLGYFAVHAAMILRSTVQSAADVLSQTIDANRQADLAHADPQPTVAAPLSRSLLRSPVLGFLGRATAALNRPVVWSILAVAAVFYGSFTVISWNLRSGYPPSGTNRDDAVVATVGTAADVKWSPKCTPKTNHSIVQKGELLRIDSGQIELVLKQGARLVVEGPAEWTVDGNNSLLLQVGKVLAHVPQQAIGFTIETPTVKLIDLGTEFGVKVSAEGIVQVAVLEGKIDISSKIRAANTSVKLRRLTAGEAVRVDRQGSIQDHDSTLATIQELASRIKAPGKQDQAMATEGIRLWLRADRGVELDAEGHVERWSDQSGHGFDAVQSESNQRPLSVTKTAQSAMRAIVFDGIDDFLTCDHGLDIHSASDMTMFLLLADVPVFMGEAGLLLAAAQGRDNGSNDGFGIDFGCSDSPTAINFGQGSLDLPAATGWKGISLRSRSFEPRWPLMVVVTKQQGTATLRINGTTVAVDTYKFAADPALLTNTAGYVIGRRVGVEPLAGINYFANISVAEMLIFDRAFTGRQATTIETQILTRFKEDAN